MAVATYAGVSEATVSRVEELLFEPELVMRSTTGARRPVLA